ncbi:hypothetical protein D3C76_1537950 [compost metagenome]
MLGAELLQHIGICGEAGFVLLHANGGQAQALKQHLPQLLGGIEIEGSACQLIDALNESLQLGREFRSQLLQVLRIGADALLLHNRQHTGEGMLQLIIKLVHLQPLQLSLKSAG